MQTTVEWHATRHSEGILRIVDGIYAAACGERPWARTLGELCRIGRLDDCILSVVDPLERRRVVLASGGRSSATGADAMPGQIAGTTQLADRILRSPPGAVWHERQVMSEAPPATTMRGTHLVRPAGFISWACLVVGRDERQVVCLEVHVAARHASSCPELDCLLRQLAPHLTRAWRLGRADCPTLAARPCAEPPSRSQGYRASAPERIASPEAARLRAEFGLTKAEARLTLRLAEGSSLASAAQAFNVKLTTIRSQLQQVFAKTGTSRQTELVAMLLSCGYGPRRALWQPIERAPHAPLHTEPAF